MKRSLGANTILYPTPVLVIGSYNKEGAANVMTAAWAGVCSSGPPAVTVSIRKERYTYDNIIERKAFTVNIPSEEHAKEADFFGIASGRRVDKFAAAGLTPVKSDIVDAPYVEEFPMILECNLLHTLEVGVHTLFVGEIIDVKCDEAVFGEDDTPDMEKLKAFAFDPSSGKYYKTGEYLGQGFSIGKEVGAK